VRRSAHGLTVAHPHQTPLTEERARALREKSTMSVPGLVVMRELGVYQHHSSFSGRTVQIKMALP
jgi:hypothetical protein